MLRERTLIAVAAAALTAAALGCGDDAGGGVDSAVPPADSAADTSATPDAAPDATPDAAPDATPDAMSDAMPDATPDGGAMVNGCTEASAMDLTGMATVSLTDIDGWSVPHALCVIVDAGTVVSWTGNFTFHPLAGGVTPTPDAASVITAAGPGTGMETISATLSDAGDFPYFCTIHEAAMQGVIYVR